MLLHEYFLNISRYGQDYANKVFDSMFEFFISCGESWSRNYSAYKFI